MVAMPCLPGGKHAADQAELEEFDAELAIRRSLWAREKLLPPLGERMPIRNTFEKMMQIFMVYTGFFVPLWACFQISYHPAQLAVDYTIDACFWVDILLTLRTAFYNENNELVIDKKVIFGTYIRKRLYFDVIANFPFELFALAAGHGIESPAFSAWRLWRMFRFFRIKRLHPKILVDLNTSGPRRLVNFFPLMTHWVACIWFAIGLAGPKDENDPLVLLSTRPDWQGGSSWLMRPNFHCLQLGRDVNVQSYVSSLYWASATLMKTAYVAPSTFGEKIFTCCILLMGAIMFALFLGQVYKILDRLDEGTAQRREKMGTFRLFCQHNKLSRTIQRKVLSYALAEWNVTQGVSTADTLKLLSPALSGQVLYEMRKDVIEACPVTSTTSLACAKKLLGRATVQVCVKNELVVGHDELARELLVLVKGSLQISLPSSKKGGKMAAMGADDGGRNSRHSKKNLMQFRMLEKKGGITGLWSPYDSGLRYPFEVQAKEFTTMLNIGRQALLEVMGTFDQDRPKIQKVLDQEFDLVKKALRLDGGRGTSVRESKGVSTRESAAEEEAAAVAKAEEEAELAHSKAQLFEINATLESVNVGLAKTHDGLASVKSIVSSLPTILEKLGHTASPADKARLKSAKVQLPPIRKEGPNSSGRSHPSASQRFADMQQQQQQQQSAEDEKTEITASSKSASDGAAAAAIVL